MILPATRAASQVPRRKSFVLGCERIRWRRGYGCCVSLLNKNVVGWEKIIGKAVRMRERGGSIGVGVGFLIVVVVVTGVGRGMMPSGMEVGVGGIVFVTRGGLELGYCVGNSDLVGPAMKSPKSSSTAGAFDCWAIVFEALVSKCDNDVLLLLGSRPRYSLDGVFNG